MASQMNKPKFSFPQCSSKLKSINYFSPFYSFPFLFLGIWKQGMEQADGCDADGAPENAQTIERGM